VIEPTAKLVFFAFHASDHGSASVDEESSQIRIVSVFQNGRNLSLQMSWAHGNGNTVSQQEATDLVDYGSPSSHPAILKI
jgi:hypothetical protein